MSTTMLIRDAIAADVPAVRDMLVETWHATYDAFYGAETVTAITDRWHSVAALTAQLGPARVCLVALRDSEIVANSYVGKEAQEPSTAKLWRLYVRPSAQGCGIGARLMEASFARVAGVRCHRLEVEPLNGRAIRFYERQGFRRVRIVGKPTSDDDPLALVMERVVL